MNKKIKIAPSLLASDFSSLGSELVNICKAKADYIHFDIMDGHFVPNLTFGPNIVKSLRKYTKKTFDVHLMVEPVDKFIKPFSQAGADIITFHPENVNNVNKTIKLIRSFKKKVGLSINPNISEKTVYPFLKKINLILVMSVYPGFGGQKFIKSQITKIKKIRKKIEKDNLNIDLEVDGGINAKNAKEIINAGANILVAGTACFDRGKKYYKKNIDALRNSK
ncbi:MAG: Ribulose-phosphate 3-epimerase [Alphaproteobacteria bacterium MarineAlpha6_Bin1]|nr:MAG: Ribulose-phosphate 3-epimerase [Alphaproteobacteria bacterium MarineAlpha6_Bin1]